MGTEIDKIKEMSGLHISKTRYCYASLDHALRPNPLLQTLHEVDSDCRHSNTVARHWAVVVAMLQTATI